MSAAALISAQAFEDPAQARRIIAPLGSRSDRMVRLWIEMFNRRGH